MKTHFILARNCATLNDVITSLNVIKQNTFTTRFIAHKVRLTRQNVINPLGTIWFKLQVKWTGFSWQNHKIISLCYHRAAHLSIEGNTLRELRKHIGTNSVPATGTPLGQTVPYAVNQNAIYFNLNQQKYD